ncbi:MAG TPA: hypothetical protein VK738_20605 [Terriglobales bacterium]|nr:hypothetical protein [Terriglobales bacterium]
MGGAPINDDGSWNGTFSALPATHILSFLFTDDPPATSYKPLSGESMGGQLGEVVAILLLIGAANACASFTPATNSPLPDSRLSC